MFQIALVIFREMLEISLILGIVLAATSSIKNSRIYISVGIMGGFIGASLLAFFINNIASYFSGFGEEIVDVIIILVTVFVAGSTAIWVRHTGGKLNKKVDKIVNESDDSLYARVMLVLVVMTAMFREGTEIVLFIHAKAASGMLSPTDYVAGFTIGIIAGIGTAIAISYGLGRIAVKYLFKVSFILLALVAASLASEAAGKLTSLGIVDLLSEPMWDSGDYVSDYSLVGKVLKMLIGYNSKPNGLELVFYLVTLFLIYIASKISASKLGKGKNVKITD
jgi:high-affinity iron transporter